MDTQDAKKRLDYGNKRYASGERIITSPSIPLRDKLAGRQQKPYAAILTCCDSYVMPEAIFGATAGELFVVRTGGCSPSNDAIGSLQYAVEELGIEYILVLGHKGCTAVSLVLEGKTGEGARAKLSGTLKTAVGKASDLESAVDIATRFSAIMVRNALQGHKVTVEPAVFDFATSVVSYI